MENDRRERLEEIMAMLAAGDEAMVFALVEEFGTELARQVHHFARSANRRLTPDEVNDLVMDSALVLAEVAGAWRPDGGALPWTWARWRVRGVVFAELFGPYPVDPAELGGNDDPEGSRPVGTPSSEPDWSGVLSDLAERDPDVAEFAAVLGERSSRDREVFIEFRLQQELHDPAPANTVGAMFDLQPDNVRKIVQRARCHLQAAGLDRVP
jgi:DNA-directed RNA polymerase specialized sigma24 family protein